MPIALDLDPEGEQKLHVSRQVGTLAIDLGSTSTVVAFQSECESTPQLLELPPITRCPGEIPSLIWCESANDPNPLIGREVIEAGYTGRSAIGLTRDFKSLIGRSEFNAPDDVTHEHIISPGHLSPEDAGECLLHQIWSHLPSSLEINRLVLSAPVASYRSYRSWLVNACSSLPVQEIALVDEPTAAAMGAGLPAGSKLLVVDLGGSTIDLSLVALEGGEGRAAPIAQLLRCDGRDLAETTGQVLRCAKVLSKAGLRFGGRDLDRWIVDHLQPNEPVSEHLLDAAERLKCRLSLNSQNIEVVLSELVKSPHGSNEADLSLSRRQLEELLINNGFLDMLNGLLNQTLAGGRRHHTGLEDLHGVVAVGGGARIALLQRWLEENTKPAPLLTPPPVEAVAVGALRLTPGVKVKDVLFKGVSLRYWDQNSQKHCWHPIFMAGQPWPTTNPLELVLAASREDQDKLEIVLGEPQLEGEHEVIYVNGMPTIQVTSTQQKMAPWSTASQFMPLDPPAQPGEDCLKLSFSIDKNATLNLEATDIRNGALVHQQSLGTVR